MHALVVLCPSARRVWRCHTRLALPEAVESCLGYTTEKIIKLISNWYSKGHGDLFIPTT